MQNMNSIFLKKKIKHIISKDKKEFEYILCKNMEPIIMNVLNDYFKIKDKTVNISLKYLENGNVKLDISCLLDNG